MYLYILLSCLAFSFLFFSFIVVVGVFGLICWVCDGGMVGWDGGFVGLLGWDGGLGWVDL